MTAINGFNNTPDVSAFNGTNNGGGSSSGLDSDAFLQLLLVQLAYQDPTAPMDSSEIVSQLADLTSVTAMTELQGSVQDLSNQLYSSQALYASTLVGQEVMVLANLIDIEAGGSVSGEILLPVPAEDLKINVYDSEGELVATLPLGEQTKSGEIDFDLADLEEELAGGEYTLEALATIDGNDIEVAITQRTTVTSVVIPGPGQEVLVEVENIGLVPLSYITKLEGGIDNDNGGGVDGMPPPEKEPLNGGMESNSYFNRELLRRYPGLHESGLVEATPPNTLNGGDSLPAVPLGPAALAVARNF